MLTASQISALRDRSEQLLDPITDFLIQDIAERVKEAGQFTGTASYNAWRLQQLGVSQKQLKKEIAKRLKVSQKEAEQLLTQAAETGYNFDISRFPTSHAIPLSANSSVQQILDATVKQAKEDLTNITQTIGFVGNDGVCRELTGAYNQACDFAFQKVSLGAQDFNSAVREATANLAKKGIRYIDYESGVHTSLEAAVRRNIMGGLGIMQNHISQQNHDYLGCDGWEISAHHGSAPDHEPYQGKQYPDKEFQRLNGSLVRPIGELNCGHAASPIIMGVNDPQYTPEELEAMRQENEEGVTFEGKHYTLYEASQRQRKIERAIRDQKRKILIDETLADTDKLQYDQIRLQVLKQNYARFSKGVGLPMQHSRLEKAGFDWKKGKAAAETEKAYRSISKMAQSDKTSNDWSDTDARTVTREEKTALIAYAEERGIKIPGLKNFDGDPELLKAEIDALHDIQKELPVNRRITLSISQLLPDDEFAETSGDHITLNAKALRNRVITERNLAEGNLFAGTRAEDIIIHEYGHVFSSFKGNKGIEIARKARYNIFEEESSLDEILSFLDEHVSPYSTVFSEQNEHANLFNLKKYKEIIPEVIVRNCRSANAFTEEFVRLLKELI